MKKMFILLIALILFTGCNKSKEIEIVFNLDENGKYTGFDNIDREMSIDDAVKEGYYVSEKNVIAGGEDSWKAFLDSDHDAQIRMMDIFGEDNKVVYTDFFYKDGLYYAFSSDNSYDNNKGYKFLLDLECKSNSDHLIDYFIILTNNGTIKYSDVLNDKFSSQYKKKKDYREVSWGRKKKIINIE